MTNSFARVARQHQLPSVQARTLVCRPVQLLELPTLPIPAQQRPSPIDPYLRGYEAVL